MASLLSEIKYYAGIYKEFLNVSFSEALSFRTSFILLILMDIFFYASALLAVSFIYDHLALIGPWPKEYFLFFIAFMLALDHLHMTFLSESFWYLSAHIRQGDLDFILLKPAPSLFCVFFRHIRPSSLCNTPLVWGGLIYFGREAELSTLSWILLPFLLLLGFALLAILEFIISVLMFWTTEGMGINFLRMQFQNLSRWPDFIYQNFSRRLLIFAFPILLIGSGPVHFLLDQRDWHLLVIMLAAVIIFSFLLGKVWQIALNRYESASS